MSAIRHAVLFVTSVAAAHSPQRGAAQDQTPDTTNFRPGHNLTLLVTIQQSPWRIKELGDLRDVSGNGVVPGLALRYSFHLNLVRKLGLLIGTGTQFVYENREHQGFSPGSSITFPSILFGLVQNFATEARTLVCAEYAATWFPFMTARAADGRIVEASTIPDSVSVFAQLDNFARHAVALSGAFGWRQIWNSCPGKCSNDLLVSRTRFTNSGWFIQTGVTWQIGDTL